MILLALRNSIFQLRNNGEKKTTKKPKWKIPQLETTSLSMKNVAVSLFTAPVCHEQKNMDMESTIISYSDSVSLKQWFTPKDAHYHVGA